jgi:hypothetical protein
MQTRTCKLCQIEKSVDEFRKRTKTAYSTMCRACEASESRAYYQANKDKILASEGRKVKLKERYLEKRDTPEYREYRRQLYYRRRDEILAKNKGKKTIRLKPRANYKENCKALFLKAVKKGIIQRQPCSECGSLKAEGHHNDYYKPLEVTWLCRWCHAKLRRKT